ncbi:MAG: DUF6512 family protein [Eubacteriales bacterium]
MKSENKKLLTWQIAGVFAVFTLAAIWHFVYAQVPYKALAVIFPVNESPWEHVKLFFFPAVILYLVQYIFVGKEYKNFAFAHALALLIMPAVMFAMFYGYRLILGIEEKLLYDIIITFIAIALGSFLAYRITISQKEHGKKIYAVMIGVAALLAAQGVLTFFQPEAPLFYDKNVDAYGILDSYDHNHDHDEDHDEEVDEYGSINHFDCAH